MISEQKFYNILPVQGFPQEKGEELDLEAIGIWLATGFFLDDDSFYKGIKWDRPQIDGPLWYYKPRNITFDDTVERFAELFETITKEQLNGRKPLLSLSGGLDSRTLAVACKRLGIEPFSYSYKFQSSYNETIYGKLIAKSQGWKFEEYEIPSGYLWSEIENAASINQCYTEFTHPRQIAVAEEIAKNGDIWLLGHMGDLLFDSMGIPDDLSDNDQVSYIYKKFVKKGGEEIATDFWNKNNLKGTFEQTLKERIGVLLDKIEISNANARTRAFKSMYSVTRWTNTNLAFFEAYKPMSLPYYDDRMCRFVSETPEEFLAHRKIQIEYIKRYAPEIAEVPWQDKRPFNLYNYQKHNTYYDLPGRVLDKLNRVWIEKVKNKKIILRNWENQFVGKENQKHLNTWLYDNRKLLSLLPNDLIEKYHTLFNNNDSVYWSHPISMIVTLSVFTKKYL